MRRLPFSLLSIGVLTVGAVVASSWLILRPGPVFCDHLAPLTVLATVAAFLIAICFRHLARTNDSNRRWFLFGCVLLAGTTLFSDFRYVRRYRDMCDQLQQQIREAIPARSR